MQQKSSPIGEEAGNIPSQTTRASVSNWRRGLLLSLLLGFLPTFGAICNDLNTVYIKLPADWTTFWLYVDGSFTQPQATVEGEWRRFALTGGPNHNATQFTFFRTNNGWNDAKILKSAYNNATASHGDAAASFTCADFQGSTVLYISENLNAPGTTNVSTTPPNAQYFYFLPPDDPAWYQGTAQMVIDGGAQIVSMSPDPIRCGWYRAVYFNQPPPTNVIFVLDVDPITFRIGNLGLDEDEPTPVNLYERFAMVAPDAGGASNLFFDSEAGAEGWMVTDPGVYRACDYQLAAFIYDTDASLHGAFTCTPAWRAGMSAHEERQSGCAIPGLTYYNSLNQIPCIGVTRGIVMPDLDPLTNKPVYNPASGCFASQAAFNQLFTSTPGVNTEYCRDISFTRADDGLWEYDSYNTPDKGYYPLEDAPNSGAGTKRAAFGGIMLGTGNPPNPANPLGINFGAINPATGLPHFDTYPTRDGEFNTGTNPDVYNNAAWGSCPNTGAPGECRIEHTLGKNQHFCFESAADFVYRPGQRFYFRGDDDIWVFINRKLVVDLGGTHLAAPGYVILDTIGVATGQPLVVGNTYPLHIFFCDRRTDMSNIRIKTNMYFSQKTGLSANPDSTDPTRYEMCLSETGGSNCAAAISGITATRSCGPQIAGQLTFYLLDRRSDTLHLNASNPQCVPGATPTDFTCYGGIRIQQGNVYIDKGRLNGLAGSYRVYATLEPDRLIRAYIDRFTTQTDVSVIGGPAELDGMPLAFTTAVSGMAGSRQPIYFASGIPDATGRFIIDTENGPGKSFQLANVAGALGDPASGAVLSVFTQAIGGTAATPNASFTIPESGLCTLWVSGNYNATSDYTYSINASGARTTPVTATFRIPRLRFVDATFTTAVPAVGPAEPVMMGTEIPLYLEAYDPADGSRCATCSFTLSGISVVPDTLMPPAVEFFGLVQRVDEFGQFTGGIVNGMATINISGAEPVLAPHYAFLTIRGPSPVTTANWDSLQFKAPPVPFPREVTLHDRNGDGIADSLVIRYNRALVADSLPEHVALWWPLDSQDSALVSKAELANYWRQNGYPDSLIVIADRDFSEAILTAGEGRIRSPILYFDQDQGRPVITPNQRATLDRIPAVITKAVHRENCITAQTCLDEIRINFSEPVTIDSAQLGELNLFQFRFLEAQLWADNVIPNAVTRYDTMATLHYTRNPEVRPRITPVALDSVKFRGSAALPLLRDLEGNFPNPREIGARIQGIKPLTMSTVTMAVLDVNTNQERLENPPVRLIPIMPGTSLDSVKASYPGTVGFLIELDIPGRVLTLELESNGAIQVEPANITLQMESYYFTNLGAFVAKGSEHLACTDAFFEGNCIDNPRYIYVAWNLVSADKRFVGSGAYIGNLKFNWSVNLPTGTRLVPDKREMNRMLGVRRGVGIVN